MAKKKLLPGENGYCGYEAIRPNMTFCGDFCPHPRTTHGYTLSGQFMDPKKKDTGCTECNCPGFHEGFKKWQPGAKKAYGKHEVGEWY